MMLEILSFIFGIGFSLIVLRMSIMPSRYSLPRKALYFILSALGITGMVWLSGVLIAHVLRKLHILS